MTMMMMTTMVVLMVAVVVAAVPIAPPPPSSSQSPHSSFSSRTTGQGQASEGPKQNKHIEEQMKLGVLRGARAHIHIYVYYVLYLSIYLSAYALLRRCAADRLFFFGALLQV